MKAKYIAWLACVPALGLVACHHGPSASSADGDALHADQTGYVKDSALSCYSEDEWHDAQDIIKQGDKAAFFAYTKDGAHCAVLGKGTQVKILTIEPDDGDQMVVVHDVDDAAAPAQLWVESKKLTLNK